MKKIALLLLIVLLSTVSCQKYNLKISFPYTGVDITNMCYSDSLSLYYVAATITNVGDSDELLAIYLSGVDTISKNYLIPMAGDHRFSVDTYSSGCGKTIEIIKTAPNNLRYTYSKLGVCDKNCDTILIERPLKNIIYDPNKQTPYPRRSRAY